MIQSCASDSILYNTHKQQIKSKWKYWKYWFKIELVKKKKNKGFQPSSDIVYTRPSISSWGFAAPLCEYPTFFKPQQDSVGPSVSNLSDKLIKMNWVEKNKVTLKECMRWLDFPEGTCICDISAHSRLENKTGVRSPDAAAHFLYRCGSLWSQCGSDSLRGIQRHGVKWIRAATPLNRISLCGIMIPINGE